MVAAKNLLDEFAANPIVCCLVMKMIFNIIIGQSEVSSTNHFKMIKRLLLISSIRSRRALLLYLIAGILISLNSTHGWAQAQTNQSFVRGVIVDPNRATVRGAVVTLLSKNFKSSITTDENGEFSILLPSGEYTIGVSTQGFVDFSQRIILTPRKSETLQIMLTVAGSTAVVNISAADAIGYRAETLSTATKTLSALRDVPQSIAVVSKQQIRDQAIQSMAEAVNYVPGIMSHQGENNRDQLVIRGVNSSADFFRDGVRDDVQYFRDLYNVDQVEALKGPNAMIFGRGGGGGVINRVMKEAGFSSIREFSIQAGSFSNKRFTGDFEQALGRRAAVRLNGMFEKSGSFRSFVDLRRYGLNPTLTFTPNPQTHINFSFEHFYDGRTADRGIPSFQGRPADVRIVTFFGNPVLSYVRARVDLLSATIQHEAGRLSIRNRTMFGDYERGYQNFVPGAVKATKPLVALSAYNNSTRRRNLFNQTDLTNPFTTGRVNHTSLAASEIGGQLTDNFRNTGFFNNTVTSIQVPYDNQLTETPVTFRQSATDANNHLQTNLAATYAQDQIELSRHMQIVAGLRFDYFDLHFHNNRNGDNLRRIDRLVSPRTGIVIKPVMPLSVYASYSVSYLPSSGDQFSSLTSVTQQVKPEKFTNYELGAKWDIRRDLTLTTAIYRQNRTNTRASDPNDPTRILQTGSQRSEGFEVGLNGDITRSWSVAGGYAYQKALITSATTVAPAGAEVALVPHDTFSLWNKYQIFPKLGVGLGIIHRANVFAAIDNKVFLPRYTKIDASLYVPFNEKWKFQAHLENVLNQKYYLTADGNNNISPGSPRAVRVSLIRRF